MLVTDELKPRLYAWLPDSWFHITKTSEKPLASDMGGIGAAMLNGREHIKLDLGNYQRGKLKGRVPTSAQLCKHRDGRYYIHIQLKDETPEPIHSDKVMVLTLGGVILR